MSKVSASHCWGSYEKVPYGIQSNVDMIQGFICVWKTLAGGEALDDAPSFYKAVEAATYFVNTKGAEKAKWEAEMNVMLSKLRKEVTEGQAPKVKRQKKSS